MTKIAYITKKFNAEWQAIIANANRIIAEYQEMGFTLTLRQLYYQFVARDLIPNNFKSYKRLGDIINQARLAGKISWEAIEDRTRNMRIPSAWDGPADIIESAARSFAVDKWQGQDYRPEVWIEKDALIGVIEGVCQELNVAYISCRGYMSQSEMWTAARRYKENFGRTKRKYGKGQFPILIHLGDHDPSGIDMSRDIGDRITMFWGVKDMTFPVARIALNMDQVQQYNPPPNPAKITDSRCTGYMAVHGDESWELDALEPQVIADLIRKTVLEYRNEDMWQERVDEEDAGRQRLLELAEQERDNE